MWAQGDAIELCRRIEEIAPRYGCHVALTGGCLYKPGPRKDCDIVVYRIRQVAEIDIVGLFVALGGIGVVRLGTIDEAWCIKATWQGEDVDFFFPECGGDQDYDEDDDEDDDGEGITW